MPAETLVEASIESVQIAPPEDIPGNTTITEIPIFEAPTETVVIFSSPNLPEMHCKKKTKGTGNRTMRRKPKGFQAGKKKK